MKIIRDSHDNCGTPFIESIYTEGLCTHRQRHGHIHTFESNVPFLHPLKTFENIW